MNDFIKKKPHREPMELQLTAMIDIFSMLVIFLIFGTVIGAADMIFPADVKLPFSKSKESTESAPQVVIGSRSVTISIPENIEIPLNLFADGNEENPKILDLTEKLKGYLEKSKDPGKASSKILNVIADSETPYGTLFSVIRVFRMAGFESLLFIAQEDGSTAKN